MCIQSYLYTVRTKILFMMFLPIASTVCLFLLTNTVLADILSVNVRGEVKSAISDKNVHKPLTNVWIQIIEIDNEPAEDEVKNHTFKSSKNGFYELKLDKSVIEDIDEVTGLKIKFWKDGYIPITITIGTISEDWADREKQTVTEEGAYLTSRDILLYPISYVPSKLEIAKFNVATDLTIFREDNLERSPSPFKKDNSSMRYFCVPKDISTLKRLAGHRHQAGQNPIFERVHGEVRPLILSLMELIAADPILEQSPHLKKVFNDSTGIELFKVIIPAGKSFTTDTDTLSDDDLLLRLKTFKLLGDAMNTLGIQAGLAPSVRRAVSKYGNVFRGYFEPVFQLLVVNNDKRDILIDKISVKVHKVEVYAGAEEKALIPITGTYEVDIYPKIGVYEQVFDEAVRISASMSDKGTDTVALRLRLFPRTPYLHSYLMSFRVHTVKGEDISTPDFVVDM